jgi:DNA-binding beta-propeller fold protein YncE
VAPHGHTLYVLSQSAGTVTEIDTTSNTIQNVLTVPVCSFAPLFSPDGSFMYLLTSSGVLPVDNSTGAAGLLVPAGSCDGDLIMTASGSTLYASGSATTTPSEST